jgi:hypothetical protein
MGVGAMAVGAMAVRWRLVHVLQVEGGAAHGNSCVCVEVEVRVEVCVCVCVVEVRSTCLLVSEPRRR